MRVFPLGLFASCLIALGSPPTLSPQPAKNAPGGGDEEPRPATPRVLLFRGGVQQYGWFDQFGDFLPDYNSPPIEDTTALGGSGPDGPPITINFDCRNQPAYEHRSGRLIRGHLARVGGGIGSSRIGGVFVPEVGSQVGDLDDYESVAGRPLVYNLPQSWPWPPPGLKMDPVTREWKGPQVAPKEWPARGRCPPRPAVHPL